MEEQHQAELAESNAPPVVAVKNGTYTVESPRGGHVTIKLHTAQKGDLAGRRILSLLVGPDNTSSYKGVAFWDDEKRVVNVWKRYRGVGGPGTQVDAYNWKSRGWSDHQKKLAIWCDLAVRGDGTGEGGAQGYWGAQGYRLLVEARCVRCNRRLTTPESIRAGMGPECSQR